MQGKASVHSGYRAQGPNHELATPDEDFGSEAGNTPRLHVGQLGGNRVPTAEVGPYLGMVRNGCADDLVRDTEQTLEQPPDFGRQAKSLRSSPHW